MLWPLSWDDGNWQSMTHTWGGVIILLPLSWDEDNLWGMIYIFGMYYHALSVVMRRRQLAGHVFKDIWYITMLSPLSWDDDNWRSMFHTLEMNNRALAVVMGWWQLTEHDSCLRGYNHTLTVVMWWWQLTEHVSYMNDILPCSDCCHEKKTTDKEFFIPYGYRLHQPKKEGTTGAFARTCPLSHGGTIAALECINHH